jgi:hypothetical protein
MATRRGWWAVSRTESHGTWAHLAGRGISAVFGDQRLLRGAWKEKEAINELD